jgi:acetyltransferase-like isoleucine patch superfamily enzyme
MVKLYILVSNLLSFKYSFKRARIYLLKRSGICFISKQVFIDSYFHCYNPGNITIGRNVSIGHFAKLFAFNKIYIGDNVQIAMGFTVVSGSHDVNNYAPLSNGMEVCIEGESWIGANVLIIGGVKVGKGVVIGAGSVVVKDLPPYTVCVGNPCKPISERIPSSEIVNPFGKYTSKFDG